MLRTLPNFTEKKTAGLSVHILYFIFYSYIQTAKLIINMHYIKKIILHYKKNEENDRFETC